MDGKQKISDPQPLPAEVAAKAVAEPPFWEGTIFRIAVLVLLTLLVYLPSFRAGFVWDDDLFVTDNVVIKAGWDGLHDIWFSKKLLAWFPMTATSWWLEWHLWGMNAAGYHVANVLLHAAGAVLLWRVLRQLKLPASWFAALALALPEALPSRDLLITMAFGVVLFTLLVQGLTMPWLVRRAGWAGVETPIRSRGSMP